MPGAQGPVGVDEARGALVCHVASDQRIEEVFHHSNSSFISPATSSGAGGT